ncbi:MAG: methylmalonyl-CoA epimerase [Anaerolineales bacterium]|nr:methylmalonyl-CoA epimerase [Anaerolineales bacterium]
MPTIKRIDHIAIVVDDIPTALTFWQDALGLNLAHVEDVPDQESVVAFLPTGESEIELVKPTTDTSGVAKFLQKRGAGMHHICLEVDDIDAMLTHLKGKGVQLINETAIHGTGGKKIAFIHPKSTAGVLVELYQLTPLEPELRLRRARTLTDRVLMQGQLAASATLAFLRALRGGNGGDGDHRHPEEENEIELV